MTCRTLVLSLTVAAVVSGCGAEESIWDIPESSGSEPRVTLEFRYPPGKFDLVNEQGTDALVTISGGGQSDTQRMVQSQLQTVSLDGSEPDASGNTTLTVRFRRIRQEITSPGMVVFDTDDPPSLTANPSGQVLAEMLQVPLKITLDGEGEVVGVTGMEGIWERLAASNPQAAAVLSATNQEQTGEAVAERMTQPMEFAPDGPVGEGAVWYVETQIPVPMVGEAVSRIRCRLLGLEGSGEEQVAVIETIGTITTDDVRRMTVGQVSMEVETMSLDLEGALRVSVGSGLIAEQSYDLTGSVRMVIRTGGRTATSQIALNGDVKTTIRPAQAGPPK